MRDATEPKAAAQQPASPQNSIEASRRGFIRQRHPLRHVRRHRRQHVWLRRRRRRRRRAAGSARAPAARRQRAAGDDADLCPRRRQRRSAVRPRHSLDPRHGRQPRRAQRDLGSRERRQLRRHRRARHGRHRARAGLHGQGGRDRTAARERLLLSLQCSAPSSRPSGRTKTLPVGNVSQVRLGVVSCSNFPAGYFNVCAELAKRTDIDVVLHLGDYIYEYGPLGYASQLAIAIDRESAPIARDPVARGLSPAPSRRTAPTRT